MARAIWKGAISFGLVHIPVALASATRSQRIDFDWLDQRSMDLVEEKASKGKISVVEQGEESAGGKGADIIDLTELLKRSLGGKGGKVAEPKKKVPARKRAGGRLREDRITLLRSSAACAAHRWQASSHSGLQCLSGHC